MSAPLPAFTRRPIDPADDRLDYGTQQIMNLLAYTKTSGSAYAAQPFPAGYHTMSVGNVEIRGQRNPKQRLADVPFDFTGKTVLDIGCNQGGMLFAIADKISCGIGIDYDPRMINAANKVRSHTKRQNLDFYIFDLEKEDLDLIEDFMPVQKIDIIFLLSVCMWIGNWQQVIGFCASRSPAMLFESNGYGDAQDVQLAYLKLCYNDIQLLSGESADDPSQKNRKLYLCR
jgi:SAM-dependent methyltransferase